MPVRILFPAILMLFLLQQISMAQEPDSVYDLTGIIYDELYIPVSATHVINVNTHRGDVTDSLGIFSLAVHENDTLLVRNIAFRDTLIPARLVKANGYIRLKRMMYPLKEARIFEWGASYEDFQEAFMGMPVQESLGASLDLPRQDPDKIPLEMDEKAVKSAGLLLTSPVSFLYYNFNRHAKSARKLYWLEKNQEKQDLFEAVTGPENLAEITGLEGSDLERFQLFLHQRMQCDQNCPELDLLREIYALWEVYRELHERRMLEDKIDQ